jgi:chromate transporter
VAAAGLAGFWASRPTEADQINPKDSVDLPSQPAPLRAGVILLLWIAVWQMPLLVLWLLPAPQALSDLFVFFSKMALVTFGGAYAVLAYVAQVAVETYGWLQPGEMVDGLALAETTPGPLVLVLSFVGFIVGFREAAGLGAVTGGIAGAVLVAWATFVPSFIWIFAGAPYVEKLRGNRALSGALSAITAAVVGVILNLALWFGLHVLFRQAVEVDLVPALGLTLLLPVPASLDPAALALFLLCALLLFRFRTGLLLVLAISVIGGLALHGLQLR